MVAKILELEERIKMLEQEVAELKRNKDKKFAPNVTDMDIELIDSLNDEDRYKICIMSGNIMAEKVGEE